MARYRATKPGWTKANGYIEKGQEFDYEGTPGSWMAPVKDGELLPVKEVVKEPLTYSEMARAQGKEIAMIPKAENHIPKADNPKTHPMRPNKGKRK